MTHMRSRDIERAQTSAAESDRIKRLDLLASYITLSSVVYYSLAIALLHILNTDFNPGYRYLSEYARGRYGVLMTSTFFVLSAGSLALLLGLARSVTSKLRFVPGLVLWFIWACAVFLAGIYTSDLQGTPHTRNGQIHDHMGMIAFPSAAFAVLLLSLAMRWETEWRSVWRPAMILSVFALVSFLALDRFGQSDLGGLGQRIFLAFTLIWMWIVAKRIQGIAKAGGVPTN
jgi:FtsH-binding integral membrane protein